MRPEVGMTSGSGGWCGLEKALRAETPGHLAPPSLSPQPVAAWLIPTSGDVSAILLPGMFSQYCLLTQLTPFKYQILPRVRKLSLVDPNP